MWKFSKKVEIMCRLKAFTPLIGRKADVCLEEAGEVAAVGEPDAAADSGNGCVGLGLHLLHGIFDTQRSTPGAEVSSIGREIPI